MFSGRSRSALERYGLRKRLALPVRYRSDRSVSVESAQGSRDLGAMAEELVATDHPSDSWNSSLEVDSEEACHILEKTPIWDNLSLEAAMVMVTAPSEVSVTTSPIVMAAAGVSAHVVGAPVATSTQVPHQEVPGSPIIPAATRLPLSTLVHTPSGNARQIYEHEPSVIFESQGVNLPLSQISVIPPASGLEMIQSDTPITSAFTPVSFARNTISGASYTTSTHAMAPRVSSYQYADSAHNINLPSVVSAPLVMPVATYALPVQPATHPPLEAGQVGASSYAIAGSRADGQRTGYPAEVTSAGAAPGARPKRRSPPVLRRHNAAGMPTVSTFERQLRAIQGPSPVSGNATDTSSDGSVDIPPRQRSPLVPRPTPRSGRSSVSRAPSVASQMNWLPDLFTRLSDDAARREEAARKEEARREERAYADAEKREQRAWAEAQSRELLAQEAAKQAKVEAREAAVQAREAAVQARAAAKQAAEEAARREQVGLEAARQALLEARDLAERHSEQLRRDLEARAAAEVKAAVFEQQLIAAQSLQAPQPFYSAPPAQAPPVLLTDAELLHNILQANPALVGPTLVQAQIAATVNTPSDSDRPLAVSERPMVAFSAHSELTVPKPIAPSLPEIAPAAETIPAPVSMTVPVCATVVQTTPTPTAEVVMTAPAAAATTVLAPAVTVALSDSLTQTVASATPTTAVSVVSVNTTPSGGDQPPPLNTATVTALPATTPQAVSASQLPIFVVAHMTKVTPYEGNTNWSTFKDHFERCAKANQWTTDALRTQHLTLALRGPAAEVLRDIDEAAPTAYTDIWTALNRRFGEPDAPREAMRRFENRRQTDTESLPEFVQALRTLFRKGWPNATPSHRDETLKRRLEDGVSSTDLQQHLRLHTRTMSFDQTATEARLYLVTQESVTKRKPSVRIAAPPHESINVVTPTPDRVDQRLEKIEKMVRCLQQSQAKKPATPPVESPRSSSGQGAWSRSGRGTPPPPSSRPVAPSQRPYRPQTPPAVQSPRRPSTPYRPPAPFRPVSPYRPSSSYRPSTPTRPPVQRRFEGQRIGCHVCGTFGCHSDRHANGTPTSRRPQSGPPLGRCYTCGRPGCRPSFHDDRRSGSMPPSSLDYRSQPGTAAGNGPRRTEMGDRTPGPQARPASR